jgi:sarcosine oxidase subunit beta
VRLSSFLAPFGRRFGWYVGNRTYDVVIIGAGIMGSALALELARSRRRVLVLDSGGVCCGSSARSAGGVRHQFGQDLNIQLAKRTIERLERFEEEFGLDCGFRQVGYMFLVSDPVTRDVFSAAVEKQRALGVPSRFISTDEIAHLVPGVRTDDLLGASFCPKDGFLDPNTVTAAFANSARDAGATIRTNSAVTAIVEAGGRATQVRTVQGDTFAADVVVNAAGAWAPRVARLYGGELPIVAWRSQVFTIHDTPDFGQQLPMVIDFDSGKAYLHPEGPGLMVGMDNEGAAEPTWEPACDWSRFPDVAIRLTARMPALENARAVAGWAGFLELTPDEDPIVGWTHIANVYTAAGFSGHGISIAPGLAPEVAREVQGQAATLDLSPYRLERFDGGVHEPEPFAMR